MATTRKSLVDDLTQKYYGTTAADVTNAAKKRGRGGSYGPRWLTLPEIKTQFKDVLESINVAHVSSALIYHSKAGRLRRREFDLQRAAAGRRLAFATNRHSICTYEYNVRDLRQLLHTQYGVKV